MPNGKSFEDELSVVAFTKEEPLNKYSTFRVGGPADYFAKAKSREDLIRLLSIAVKHQVPYFVIGGGTNLLISDSGFRGLIIKNETSSIKFAGLTGERQVKGNLSHQKEAVFLEVDSGVSVNRLVRYSVEQGLSGMQDFLGQPGSIGGGLYINAHNINKGQFLGNALYRAAIFTKSGTSLSVDREYFRFGYDESRIQHTGDIICSALFIFTRGDKRMLWEQAQSAFDYRKKSQPYGVFTSGCTFRNISKSDAMRLSTPDFTCSAGYILDSLGLKAKHEKGAYFSPHHANFIINDGSARAADIYKLIRTAKNEVKKRYNIDLMEEIVLVGDF